MKNNIFIPKKIKVGFQERSDTYTQKLAYIIYYDAKNKLRKEISWTDWRDKKISPIDVDNTPVSGFVLNKKVGGDSGHGWDARKTYVRVYDPRDFEFEISIPNLIYILENVSSIVGKGLEGDFVYGWSGAELILMPVSSPDYGEIKNLNNLRFSKKKIKTTDLIIGATYRHRSNVSMVYMGRFDRYQGRWGTVNGKNLGKHHFFLNTISEKSHELRIYKSLGDNFIEIVDDKCVDNYAELFEKVEKEPSYSPIDTSKDEYKRYTVQTFIERCVNHWSSFFTDYRGDMTKGQVHSNRGFDKSSKKMYSTYYHGSTAINENYGTIEDLIEDLKPCYQKRYLANGKLYSNSK